LFYHIHAAVVFPLSVLHLIDFSQCRLQLPNGFGFHFQFGVEFLIVGFEYGDFGVLGIEFHLSFGNGLFVGMGFGVDLGEFIGVYVIHPVEICVCFHLDLLQIIFKFLFKCYFEFFQFKGV
jgi:hypothetical protein